MAFLYNVSICCYLFLIHVAGLFNNKAKQWIAGRKNIFERIQKDVKPGAKLAWFHCASLGEFEQARPVIEEFKKLYPHYKLLLTFFSPSGYEVRRNYEFADFVYYMPIDTPSNARRFLDLVNPSIVFFVKYEFWFNYIIQIKKKNIPFFVFSAIFRENQHFFKWYGGWFRKQLKSITHIFVQNTESLSMLQKIGVTQVSVCGDTRFDRVNTIARNVKAFPLIKKFCEGSDVFIAGSSWPPDEELLTMLINSNRTNFKFIIAPHMVDLPHIVSLGEKLKGQFVKYSEADEENITRIKVMIIDSIGILSHVYQYGKLAYIGGGFGSGIHNILEAATFGLPVIFGPKYHKFREAVDLIKEGGAYSISNENEFMETVMKLYNEPELLKEKSQIARNFVQKNIGATDIILKKIEKSIVSGH